MNSKLSKRSGLAALGLFACLAAGQAAATDKSMPKDAAHSHSHDHQQHESHSHGHSKKHDCCPPKVRAHHHNDSHTAHNNHKDLTAVYEQIDADKNGFVSFGEWTTFHKSRATESQKPVMSDQRLTVTFERLDLDKNGGISIDEWNQARDEMKKKREERREARRSATNRADKIAHENHQDGPRKKCCPPHVRINTQEMFSKIDIDANGSISLAEFEKHHEEMHEKRRARR